MRNRENISDLKEVKKMYLTSTKENFGTTYLSMGHFTTPDSLQIWGINFEKENNDRCNLIC